MKGNYKSVSCQISPYIFFFRLEDFKGTAKATTVDLIGLTP